MKITYNWNNFLFKIYLFQYFRGLFIHLQINKEIMGEKDGNESEISFKFDRRGKQ